VVYNFFMAASKKLSEDDVKHLAKLANLTLTSDEIKKYSEQLSSILDYVELLNEVDTSNVESTSSTVGLDNVSRTDEAKKKQTLTSLDNLKIVEKNGKNYFLVKRIL